MMISVRRITPHQIRFQLALLLGGLALAGISGMTAGAAEYERTTQQVAYGDLNLATSAGRDALLQRVRQAATAVCGGPAAGRDLQSVDRFHACRDEAMAAVMPTVQTAIDGAAATRIATNTGE